MADDPFGGIRRLLRIGAVERDLDEELAHHFQRTVEELMAEGMDPQEARDEAHRRFGDEQRWRSELSRIDRAAEEGRRRADLVTAARDSFRFAWRGMRGAPGFTAAVVLAFALGIGANATMFGIVDRLLLSPPAGVAQPDRVVRLVVERYFSFLDERRATPSLTYPDFQDFLAAPPFAAVAAYAPRDFTLGRGADAREVHGELASADYFRVLGVEPVLGRTFSAEDDVLGAPGTAVLSWDLWQEAFGGRSDVLGAALDFGAGPWTVVGVAPRGFGGIELERADLWVPLNPAQEALTGRTNWQTSRSWWWLRVVARLAPTADVLGAETAATALHRTARREEIERENSTYDANVRVLPTPLLNARGPLASEESKVARWLAGVAGLVLLIACANVAGLLLARALRRRREIAVRLAMGISRRRLLAHVLTESLLLAFLGGTAAVLITRWAGTAMRTLLLPDVAWGNSPVDGRVLLFIGGAAVVAGLAAGVVPALQASRPDLLDALKAGAREGQGRTARLRGALTVVQAALSVVLLVGAGLFLRSMDRVSALDTGVDLGPVLMVSPDMETPSGSEGAVARRAIMLRALERIQALPQVTAATASQAAPFWSTLGEDLRIEGFDSVPSLPTTGGPTVVAATPGYAATLDLEVLRGRDLRPEDQDGAPVALVDEVMARVVWQGRDPIGTCLYTGGDDAPCSTIVGVVEGAKQQQLLEEERMQYYVPLPAGEDPWQLLVRVRGDPLAAVDAVRRAAIEADGRVRWATVEPMQNLMDRQTRGWKLGAAMFTAFGILALVVAAFGLYTVLAFSIAQRTRELGVRSALGASRERLVAMVMGDAVRLTLVGSALGLVVAWLAAPRLADLLYETSPHEPLVYALVLVTLLGAALAAGALPSWRATRVSPLDALRTE